MTTYGHRPEHMLHAWRTLGLRANPTYEEIRAAYRRLAFATHPDRSNEPGTKERFQKLQAAYEAAVENCRRMAALGGYRLSGDAANFDWRAEVARVREAWARKHGLGSDAAEEEEEETTARKKRQQTKTAAKGTKTAKPASASAAPDFSGTNSPTPARGRKKASPRNSRRQQKRGSATTSRWSKPVANKKGKPKPPFTLFSSPRSPPPPASRGADGVVGENKSLNTSRAGSPGATTSHTSERRAQVVRRRRRCFLSNEDKMICRLMAVEAARRLALYVFEGATRRIISQMLAEVRIRCAIKQFEDLAWKKLVKYVQLGPNDALVRHKGKRRIVA
ncbi:chaperone protein DNAj, putative [Trypanosoma brucei gambiense DAL972]|uniref:Chaperone protein DNAj, putative n=2 Tax=Trypanosoma brucei TaxID=5691 RepID=C9ZMU3_TRYB9|nr:chaperone protein DNAj, putative [Trypanosoma brucei gambiense DAL972]RHW72710.1 chaperone protein DNAj [Trypanosoma brucei equiperdum]CBH10596.1 chaperone protein DNAj, putative [Trypanosoma brucei gambiense DAL972]|eukprot:XP_011772885.1 chaperone protein DNAj, putative [Trypanosoma brucei gambiense DAL972]